ncbi:MAG TPA: Type 1 glutamine amidotransferase-like domain-containing protein [Pyrinomonadaceae bacterium]|nr:Type 1 glutamine amidotransferase-like domain-containing protein [Pyrinomonadaceae bacterium]
MKRNLQPIYLFADSQLLFWSEAGRRFLDSIRQLVKRDSPQAAYIGASNGDEPQFYSIFEAAMDAIGIHKRRMLLRSFSAEEQSFLREADIILLAGGDVERGWNVFVETGMRESIIRRYDEGAVLMGISAGAVQLGLYGSIERGASPAELLGMFKLVPFVIDAHDEARKWGRLRRAVGLLDGTAQGIGVPTGGGAIYYPDGRLEAIRYPLYQVSVEGGKSNDAWLLPKQASVDKSERDALTDSAS